jgi:hypothetical protein
MHPDLSPSLNYIRIGIFFLAAIQLMYNKDQMNKNKIV